MINPELVYVIVLKGEKYTEDRFFVCTKKVLRDAAFNGYKAFLDKHDGRRPQKQGSERNYIEFSLLTDYEDRWDIIKTMLAKR